MHDDTNKILTLAERFEYSPFMIRQIMKNFPNDHIAALKAFAQPAPETIRVNTLKISPEELKTRLEEKGFKLTPVEWLDYAFHVDSTHTHHTLGATHEYLKGFYYLQSLGSMIPVHLLYPKPGDQILDMCAAPGSKTTQIAQYMQNQGQIIAIDIKKSRINSLISNIRRMDVRNAIIFPFDATQLYIQHLGKFRPNKILLDAPCTGSGILRHDPSIKRMKNDSKIHRLRQQQKKLLKAGLKLLPKGGTLVYSTCSFHYQENEMVVAEVLKEVKNVEIIEPQENIGLPGFSQIDDMEFGYNLLKSRRLTPHLHNCDAFFYCILQKS
ncbi:MAG: RsmB/NOP family class I SAM-dependent RNA methyltransferase [Candidatus Lokiarchaeota archaeon]|nr:RsmB/NOP family class I SAM-dependent RNA methyltransferase [Candidatus Harpocratesius repetitus]